MISPEEQEKLLKIRKVQLKAELERRQKEIADYFEHASRTRLPLIPTIRKPKVEE